MGISTPAPICSDHNTAEFNCGHQVLDDWLKRTALKNEQQHASRTFVVCDERRVVGFYSLASGSVEHVEVSGKVRRNMPDPIPVIVLGRLAVDLAYQGKGIGPALLKDALLRAINVSQHIGVKAMLVHAISEEAKRFYLCHGFVESPINDMTLMITIKNAIAHGKV